MGRADVRLGRGAPRSFVGLAGQADSQAEPDCSPRRHGGHGEDNAATELTFEIDGSSIVAGFFSQKKKWGDRTDVVGGVAGRLSHGVPGPPVPVVFGIPWVLGAGTKGSAARMRREGWAVLVRNVL